MTIQLVGELLACTNLVLVELMVSVQRLCCARFVRVFQDSKTSISIGVSEIQISPLRALVLGGNGN